MQAFALENLRSFKVTPCLPWEFKVELPKAVAEEKKARLSWITNKLTRHQVYSLVEGVYAGARVEKPRGDSPGNPPRVVHGVAADYDGRKWLLEEVQRAAAESPYPPAWYERTMSGYCRLVWVFERPVMVADWDSAAEFLETAANALKAGVLLPGLDRGSFDPGRYYTNSCEWYPMGGAPIPAEATAGWIFEVAKKSKGSKEDIEIPMDVVADALKAKYPRFAEWDGDFSVGSQGPSFWVDGSVSLKSALVKPGGIYTFADHATRPFWSWADLLGEKFVAKYRTERTGGLIDGIYFDVSSGRYYFPTSPTSWIPLDGPSTERQLRVRGASGASEKGKLTEAATMLAHIQLHQYVSGAGPYVYRPPGVVWHGGDRYLNTCSCQPIKPSGQPEVWGPEGNFPFISRFLDSMFYEEPLSHFLGWAKLFYRSGIDQKPTPGQAAILCAPPASGKTFLLVQVLSPLYGGGIDVTRYVTGEDTFSGPYLERPLWYLDDHTPAENEVKHRAYTHRIKSWVSRGDFVSNAKFRGQLAVKWMGRVIICLNDDDSSREALPSPTSSNSDKLCFYRLRSVPADLFSRNREENDRRAAAELPHFAQWLLDYEIPAVWLPDDPAAVRTGIASYHDPDLLLAAEQNDDSTYVLELLLRWRREYFGREGALDSWEGTSTEFLRELQQYEPPGSNLVQKLTTRRVGNFLRILSSKKSDLVSTPTSKDGVRHWRFDRLATDPKPGEREKAETQRTVTESANFKPVP